MTQKTAAGTRILALGILAAAAGFGLAGCGSIDQMLFGGGTEEAAQPPANAEAPPANAAQVTPPPAPIATGEAAPAPIGGVFTPVTIQPGSDTGTAVSHNIASLRTQVEALGSKLGGDAQHFQDLRASGAQSAATYQASVGQISTRLQVGTTRGNPELIGQWNNAQSALDSLTANINALSQLATEVSNDSSAAHYALDTIQATFNISGAVDEDHRQLTVLSDETSQTIVLIDRLLTEVSQAVQRQTAFVANERGNLTTLASAIKAGEYYSPVLATPAAMTTSSNEGAYSAAGGPIVTIKFDRAHTSYDRVLYSALSQALAARPSASFNVIAVSPTRGTAAAVQLAQNGAQRHAQEVMRSMSAMGVPATRMSVSSSTDPSISDSEVRVFMR